MNHILKGGVTRFLPEKSDEDLFAVLGNKSYFKKNWDQLKALMSGTERL
jgi:hypothetical protein